MEVTLKKTERNVQVLTSKEINQASKINLFKGKKPINNKQDEFVLVTDTVFTSLQTTNGFNSSIINFRKGNINPKIILSSFDLANDNDNRIILELKMIFQETLLFLNKLNINLHSGIIRETVLFDNEDDIEHSFSIDIFIDDNYKFEELLVLEESLWDHMENADRLKINDDKTIEVIISLNVLNGDDD